jgi:chromosome segregation ATPase
MNIRSITFFVFGLMAILGTWNTQTLLAQPPTGSDSAKQDLAITAESPLLSDAAKQGRLADVERMIETKRQSLSKVQERIASEQKKLETIEPAIGEKESNIQKLDQELFEASLSPLSFPEVLATLQSMRVQLKVDLAGMRARLKVMRELNEKGNPSAAINEKRLEIAQRILAVAAQRTAQTKKLAEAGHTNELTFAESEIELHNAELRVVEAKAALEAARADSAVSNREIILEQAEKESRLEEVESMLKSAASARQSIREIELQQQAVQRLRDERQESAKKLERLESQLEGEQRMLEQLNAALEENRRFFKK